MPKIDRVALIAHHLQCLRHHRLRYKEVSDELDEGDQPFNDTAFLIAIPQEAAGELEDLAREAVQGGGYCARHDQEEVADPLADPDAPSEEFFDLENDYGNCKICEDTATGDDGLCGDCREL